MKSQTLLRIAVLAALSTGSCLGQAFTYQGLLQDGGQPANGVFDLSFGLFSAESGGTATATLQVNDLAVTNGVFTAVLDFPPSSFIGAPRWIGLSVRPGTATGAFTALTPRQPVTSTPYAIHAGTVNASGLIGQVTDANLSATLSTPRAFTHPGNTFTGNGANLTGLNASQLTTGTLPVARLAPGSIGSVLLEDGAVGSAQVANGSLTAQDLSPSIGLWNAIGPAVVRPTGNVAIGRETTRFQFEVSGTMGHVQTHPHFAPADGTVLLGTYQGRTTNAAQLRFNRETPGAIYTDIGQHKEGQFVVEQNDIIRLMVRPDGRVGINTSNPGAALDVWGQMHVTEQGGIQSLGPRNTYAGMIEAWYGPNDRYGLAQLPNGITALYSAEFYGPSSIQFGQMTGADSFKSQVVIDHGGNLGINTLTPQARLEVVGDSADSFIGPSDGTGLVNFGPADKQHTTINEGQLASFNGNSPSTLYLNFAGGNVAIGQVPNPSAKLHVAGEAKATVFTPTSDRNAKQNFTSVNPREVLAKVAALSITEWSYKTISDVRHIGPVAQDFYAAFGVGGDDKGISTVDADGVALAAIQGLNEKLGEKEAELLRLRAENQGLARRLGAIERALRMQGMDVEAK
jgi:hypothetical protein